MCSETTPRPRRFAQGEVRHGYLFHQLGRIVALRKGHRSYASDPSDKARVRDTLFDRGPGRSHGRWDIEVSRILYRPRPPAREGPAEILFARDISIRTDSGDHDTHGNSDGPAGRWVSPAMQPQGVPVPPHRPSRSASPLRRVVGRRSPLRGTCQRIRGRHGARQTPEEAAAGQGDPDSLSPREAPRRKACELKRAAWGSPILDSTARRVRLKLRLLTAENSGAPGETRRLMGGQKTCAGQIDAAREPSRAENLGQRRVHTDTKFPPGPHPPPSKKDFAMRQGRPSCARTPMGDCTGFGDQSPIEPV